MELVGKGHRRVSDEIAENDGMIRSFRAESHACLKEFLPSGSPSIPMHRINGGIHIQGDHSVNPIGHRSVSCRMAC